MTDPVPAKTAETAVSIPLPDWARQLIALYESNAANQFILHGNVGDRMLLPLGDKAELGSLTDFLLHVLLPRFDVVLSYDLGNGLRVEKGGEIFSQWPQFKDSPQLPSGPREAIEALTHYFRYCGNLARLKTQRIHVGCILRAADLVLPGLAGGLSYELNAMALQVRDWSTETILTEQPLATFLLTENLHDLHPHLVNNNRAGLIRIPLPSAEDLRQAFALMAPSYPAALGAQEGAYEGAARQLVGATLASVEGLLKTREHAREPLKPEDLAQLKKQIVEKDCNGLIEFVESKQTLDDLYGQEKIKQWLKQDLELWRRNDLQALPMGYLLCGPVGTGKTFMVYCLAGQAGVPVVKIKNFRDKWVGSSEGNLETIFRLLHALGRCFVFIDEADQALGRRDSGTGDSGVSGRLYSMMAEEMGDPGNRGRIIWILASSRPDLIEVDLKRPGRVDVKIPVFPTTTPEEGFALLGALCRRRGLSFHPSDFDALKPMIPAWLTPGAAETLAVKIYRMVRTQDKTLAEAARACLQDYQNPVPPEVMEFQIQLAVREASDLEFVPACFRPKA
ncbi:MAG: ATP-binding protein [Candidatus Sumerlaeota bacterium]|nr:ATP-binding protein [Candidatus Sumerlaeota bacterium]